MSGLSFSDDDRLRLVGQILGRRPPELRQVLLVAFDLLQVGLDVHRQIRILGLDRRPATLN